MLQFLDMQTLPDLLQGTAVGQNRETLIGLYYSYNILVYLYARIFASWLSWWLLC